MTVWKIKAQFTLMRLNWMISFGKTLRSFFNMFCKKMCNVSGDCCTLYLSLYLKKGAGIKNFHANICGIPSVFPGQKILSGFERDPSKDEFYQ